MTTHAEIIARWNAQADEHNQWDELGEDEKIEWAFACGASAVPARPTRQELEAVLSAMGEEGNPVKPADIPSATASPAVILELMTERDKLREALERIAGTKATPGENGWSHWIEQARDALEAIATADDLGRAAAPQEPQS